MAQKFRLRKEHVILLRNSYMRWDDCETGAIAVDPKRPYGNSYVAGDVAELLGIEADNENGFTSDQEAELLSWHYETEQALIVILSSKSFKLGKYIKSDKRKARWKKVIKK